MANEGSRRNPFSMNQFNSLVNSDHWQGGWVTHDEGLVYHSQNLSTCTFDGSLSNPIPSSFYNEMLEREIWLGGWVSVGVTEYYDSNGIQYDANIGDENNPCPINVYNEIVSNGFWEGGWIQESDGSKRYVRRFPVELISGDGCGCGSSGSSGSGDGCGSGGDGGCGGCDGGGCCSGSEIEALGYAISAGSDTPGIIMGPNGRAGEVTISWTDGNTFGLNGLSLATITISFTDHNYGFQDYAISALWENPYQLTIRGNFTVVIEGDNNLYRYSINAIYTIPEEYHQYVPID